MAEENTYTIEEANQHFAIQYNNNIWNLLSKTDKTDDDYNEMINLAHASLLHWSKSSKCKKVNLQRGEYMIAMTYIYAERAEPALYHAQRCFKLSEEYKNRMKDFDIAYAYLIMSGALNISGLKEESQRYLQQAKELGETIADQEDKNIFLSDLNSSFWNS